MKTYPLFISDSVDLSCFSVLSNASRGGEKGLQSYYLCKKNASDPDTVKVHLGSLAPTRDDVDTMPPLFVEKRDHIVV
jgi:hypothetical protein